LRIAPALTQALGLAERDDWLRRPPVTYKTIVQSRLVGSVELDLAVHHTGDVAAAAEELHYTTTLARERCPARIRVWVLLQSSESLAVEGEVDLAEFRARCTANGVAGRPKRDLRSVQHQDLAPNRGEGIEEVIGFAIGGHAKKF
jgi:hypothetical protein